MTDPTQPTPPDQDQERLEHGAMEWLHDTLDQPPPAREARLGRGFPWATAFFLVLGVAAVALVLWLLLGSPPPGFQVASNTPTPTATMLLVFRPTATPTPAVTLTPTATAVFSPAVPQPFEIGDRVVITGTGTRGLRLRAGAGLAYDTLEVLEDGAVFFVLPGDNPDQAYPVEEAGYTWWRLRAPDGLIGWTVEDYLLPQPLVAETPAAADQ